MLLNAENLYGNINKFILLVFERNVCSHTPSMQQKSEGRHTEIERIFKHVEAKSLCK